MKIKSAEITGFKSFSDKATLHFLPGITALVGPNGCGKSNVVDAFRWAMGEQSAKQLRGHIMEDIIFNGSETKKPMSMAEVSIVFSNENGQTSHRYSTYSELTVTRRLFRSGESEYYINKIPCRLKDIIELFLDTGAGPKAYSIIEQGKVEHVINAKPLERRLLIDEAAGISKYKSRKKEALAKMESTQNNLLRIDDILAEVNRQLNAIRRQAAKLKRYQALKEEIQKHEVSVSLSKYRSLKDKHRSLQALLEERTREEMRVTTALSSVDAAYEQEKINLNHAEKMFQSFQEELYKVNSAYQKEESHGEYLSKEIQAAHDQQLQQLKKIEMLNERVAAHHDEEKILEGKNAEHIRTIAESTAELTHREERLSDLKEAHTVLRTHIEGEKNHLIDLLTDLARLTNHLTQLEKNHLSLLRKIDYTRDESVTVSQDHHTMQQNLSKLLQELSHHHTREQERLSEKSLLDSQIGATTDELCNIEQACADAKDKYEKISSRLLSLQELQDKFEECENGVRSIMLRTKDLRDDRNGICGLLADFIQTEPQYETALEAVLGDKLHYIIVESHLSGIEALDYIKLQSLGKASIVPLHLRKHHEPHLPPWSQETTSRFLSELVTTRPEYRVITDHLLADVILVDSLTTALQIWNNNGNSYTLVTLEGEVIDPAGIITGGRHNGTPAALLSKRREIKELQAELAQLTPHFELLKIKKHNLAHELSALREKADALKEQSHQEALQLISLNRDLAQLQRTGEEMKQRIELLAAERQESERALSETSEESVSVQQERQHKLSQKSEKEGLLRQLQEQEKESALQIESLNGEITSLKITIAAEREKHESALRAMDRIRSTLTLLADEHRHAQEQNEEMKQRSITLTAEREESTTACEAHLASKQDLEHSLDNIRQDIVHKEAALREQEILLKELRRSLEDHRTAIHDLNLRITESNLTTSHLLNDIEEKYHTNLENLSSGTTSDCLTDESHAVCLLDELKEKLERLGEVNLAAAQEEEELSSRHQFLSEQREDLMRALESLHQAIKKINRTTRQRFLETFHMVNDQFKSVFPELFQGGRAELKLTDEENILETGIDIVAQPPGKKLQGLDLLSGGEKSLTAFALLISIFLVKPSPFCVLDEADSALDDINATRFNHYLKNMSHASQFIIITHNKLTMQAAHTLYGITMQEPGTSKVVSVQLQ